MAKELYISGSYIVATQEGVSKSYSVKSLLDERSGNFNVRDPKYRALVIEYADAGDWTDAETGGAAYTEATMRQFLRDNTQVFSSASGGSGALPLELTVDMTSADILGAVLTGLGVFELIPTPGAGKYIDVEAAILEYTYNGVVYVMSTLGWRILYSGGAIIFTIDKSVCTSPSDQIRIARRLDSVTATIDTVVPVNESVGIVASDLIGFTLGNGTMKIKLTYFIRTLG